MVTLIIDVSTVKPLVLFAFGNEPLLTLFLPEGPNSSRYLMGQIEEGLIRLKIAPASLKAIAASTGPGSFTGIRVGVAAALGLGHPLNLPLIGFCSLQGFICAEEGSFVSLIDARIGGFYLLLRERKGDRISELGLPIFVEKEKFNETFAALRQAGPHASYPDPHYLAAYIEARYQNGEYAKNLELTYLTHPRL